MTESQSEEIEIEEILEPGKPLRPDPGSPETPGGSMEPRTPVQDDTERK